MNIFKKLASWTNRSIRRKLLIWSISFWLIFITSVGLAIFFIGQIQSVNQTRERNVQLASIISRDISAQVGGILSDIRTFSHHLELTGSGTVSQADALLSLRLSAPQRYLGVYLFDLNSDLLVHLTESQESIMQLTGAAIAERAAISVPNEVSQSYRQAVASGTSISEVDFTDVEQNPELYVGIPLNYSNGEKCVAVFEIGLQDIWQRIEMRTFGQSGFTFAISRDGKIIAHPDPAYIGRPAPSELIPVTQGFEGFTTYNDSHLPGKAIAAYSPVGVFTGWGIVVVQLKSEAYASIWTFGLLVIGIWVCLAALITAVVMVLIRNFTRPIVNLTKTAHIIAETGDLTKTTTVHQADEVGQMSQAFDQMVERLQQSEDKAANAAAEERTRLARDLHDAVSQTLFSASMISEVLPKLWEKNPEEGRRRLEEVRQLTKGALAEMRTLLFELRPAALVDAETGYLLRQLAESISGRTKIAISVQMKGVCNPPPDVKIALYRIAQEALNNVAKHSGATQANVYVNCQEDTITLQVNDNGKGFDIAGVRTGSLGLGIMRERARKVGAEIKIESKPGEGSTVLAVWRQ